MPLFSRLRNNPLLSSFLILFSLTGIIYLFVFTLHFPLARFFNTVPPVDYAKLTDHSIMAFIFYLVAIIALYGLYVMALKQNWSLIVPYSGAAFALILFFAYPVMAIDLFVYAIYSRGWGLYGLNPLATPPADFPAGDPWLGLAAEWIDNPSPYGPLWEVPALGAFNLSGGNFLLHLFLLKALAIAGYIVAVFLIGAIASKLHPRQKVTAMMIFAWNPLVLLETAQNGHNDILMVVFMLAAIWALVTEKDFWVMPLLALSVPVKFVTVLIAPFFILYLALKHSAWPRRFAAFIFHNLIFLILVALLMIPMWPGLDNWAILRAGKGAGRSLLATLVLSFRPWLGVNTAFDVGRWLIIALFAAISLGYLWRSRRRFSEPTTPIYLSWAVLFWYVLLAAPVFHGWYILWFLPLAALLAKGGGDKGKGRQGDKNIHRSSFIVHHSVVALRASIVFSFTALLVIPYWETIRVWYPFLFTEPWGHLIGASLLLLPPAVVALWPPPRSSDKETG